MEKYVSIGKILNFHGIKGEAKVGYTNENQIKSAKNVIMLDNKEKTELNISSIRFHKNFAIVKFKEINDINDLMEFKGQRIFVLKEEASKKLEKDEFLIQDLIGCAVFNTENEKIGTVTNISTNSSQDLLNIKNLIGQEFLVPFVKEFFPRVDIKNKKITIKPIEGLISWNMTS